MRQGSFGGVLVALLLVSAVHAEQAPVAQQPYIAGLAPDRRPESAPTVQQDAKAALRQQAGVAGIQGQPPASLRKTLEFQGAWYTPILHRGMNGRYDLLGRHADASTPSR